MRRDLVYFYPAPMKLVYDAFYNAANQRFGKDCKADPFKTLQFGLNYSFKYNMNGGSITAHFMPYQNGIAVNLRYTIIQAFGARYQKHAQDYTAYVDGLLNSLLSSFWIMRAELRRAFFLSKCRRSSSLYSKCRLSLLPLSRHSRGFAQSAELP